MRKYASHKSEEDEKLVRMHTRVQQEHGWEKKSTFVSTEFSGTTTIKRGNSMKLENVHIAHLMADLTVT